jgi:hypothetical protein
MQTGAEFDVDPHYLDPLQPESVIKITLKSTPTDL